jgi:hypothetical protein
MIQVKTPNLDPVIYQGGVGLNDWSGWCLAYVQTAFGVGWAGSTAWDCWTNRLTKKHADRNLPAGVYIPIFFSGYYGMGHTAIYKDGKVWSSPLTHKPYADVFNSIGEVERSFGVVYVGWSEDLGGSLVVESAKDIITPNQRVVGPNGANYRSEPNSTSTLLKEFDAGEILNFKGFVKGQDPYGNGNNIWFVGAYSGGFVYSGATTDPSTNGLSDLTPTAPEPPKPTYTFTKDLACVTEVKPASIGNFAYGEFPPKPEKVVIHDFGTLGKDTYEGTVAWFQNPKAVVSAHFVVSGKKITQMVSLKDRAYHAGPNGNGFIGIETDPKQDQDTINSVKTVLTELKAKYGYQFPLIEHNQIMDTACGDDVDLKNYDITPVVPPVVTPPVVVPPETPKPPVVPENGSETLLTYVLNLLSKIKDWLSQWRKK